MGAYEVNGVLAIVSGDRQNTDINTAFANPLVVSLASSYGDLLNGTIVTFSAPSSGPSVVFTSGIYSTITNGQASLAVSANDQLGSYIVTASVHGADPLEFHLTNGRVPLRVAVGGSTSDPACGINFDWSNPCDLQFALSIAAPGDEIWVKGRRPTVSSAIPRSISPP